MTCAGHWLAAVSLATMTACSTTAVDPDGDAARDGGDTTASCVVNPLTLLVRDFGGSERYYVEIALGGARRALAFDTGSGVSFLFTGAGQPDYEPDIATIGIGCETLSIAGRGFDAGGETVQGLEVVGLLGMDFLLAEPTLVDVESRLLVRSDAMPPDAEQTPGAFAVAFDNVSAHALVPLALDGGAIRLMLDSAGGDTLRVGVEGNPGDTVTYVQDFEGNVFPIYTGTGVITFPGQDPRTVVVARAPEFPYFQDTVTALGGNLHGLLGVTTFPGERLLVDGNASLFWVIPKH